jgi:hypothetical protein
MDTDNQSNVKNQAFTQWAIGSWLIYIPFILYP